MEYILRDWHLEKSWRITKSGHRWVHPFPAQPPGFSTEAMPAGYQDEVVQEVLAKGKKNLGASKVARWVKVFAVKSSSLSFKVLTLL